MINPKVDKEKLILLTGGAGYVGSTLCRELLSRGYRVRVIDCLMHGGSSISVFFNHPNFEFIKADITDSRVVEKAFEGVCCVIHLAALVGDRLCERNPELTIETNYKATQFLADVAQSKNIDRFILASTCSAYGIVDASYPAKEEDRLNPVSLYAETKIDCERYLLELAKTDRFCPIILRFGTAFGISGRTRFDLTANSFTYEALKYKKVIVFAGEAWRPYTHVLDMARIYYTMLEVPRDLVSGQIFNAGWNSQNYTKKQIVDVIKEVLEKFEIDYISNIEDKRNYRVDFTKIEKVIKFLPLVSLKEGVCEIASALRLGLLTEQDYENSRLK